MTTERPTPADGAEGLPEARQAAAMARLAALASEHRRINDAVRQAVLDARAAGVSGRRVAEVAPVGYATVERWWAAARATRTESED